MHQLWSQADGKNKSAVDTYGAEHMARLLGKTLGSFPTATDETRNTDKPNTQSPSPS